MPVTSKAQQRFMAGVASGSIKRKGLTKQQAQEFLDATPKGKKLPARAKKKTKAKKRTKKRASSR